MSTNNSILNSIKKIIYDDPLNAELSSEDVDLLNSLPADEIASILKETFDTEKDFIVRSKIYEAIFVLKKILIQFSFCWIDLNSHQLVGKLSIVGL